jgi:hypothetical protein
MGDDILATVREPKRITPAVGWKHVATSSSPSPTTASTGTGPPQAECADRSGYPGLSAAEGLAVLTSAAFAGDANAAVPPTVPTRRIT